MPDVMGHVPGFDPLIANFVAADLLRVIDLYFVRDHSKELKKKNDEVAETKLRNGKSINGKHNKSTGIAKFPPMTSFQAFDYLIMNHRNIGTPYRVRNVPNFKDSDPSYVPSRASFLLRKFVTVFLAYGLLDLLTCQPPPEPWLFTRHQEYFITRLNEVTWKEIQFRIITNLNLWASTYLLTQYVFAIIAFVGVASGVYKTADFPPLEGPVKYTWSIRTWWGRFWHQILQSPLTSNANAITRHTVPASLQRSLLARYSKIFWVFVLSGLCHMVSPLGSTGGYQHARGSAWFFPAQALGILIEDLVMAGYKKVVGRKEGEKARTWERLVGYLWAWSWMRVLRLYLFNLGVPYNEDGRRGNATL
ncbi:membrane bound O-acyl transferase family-domain-containing protein [Bisporella sp. PMI_857]|nr:membrane bound O-acyl transferase family-domain-containing protein [Bisporella sp. PMI_857]